MDTHGNQQGGRVVGGARAVEHLRLIMAELMVATVRAQVLLSLCTNFEQFTTFTPDPLHEPEVHTMLDQYNSLNGNFILAHDKTYGTNGASWLVPQAILAPRLLKFGMQMSF